ncbi:MAG: hypothetical protein KBD30_02515 [Legionellaceae bacterium]|nr:hypothetical protein [Legionellaceae bacterium]
MKSIFCSKSGRSIRAAAWMVCTIIVAVAGVAALLGGVSLIAERNQFIDRELIGWRPI